MICISGFAFLCETRLLSLKPSPTNHILKEALATSSSVGPFFLNQPRVKTDGKFKSSHLPKANLPNKPIKIPTSMVRRTANKDLNPIFTPKRAGFTVAQKLSLFSVCLALSLTPGRPCGFSVRVVSVLRTTVASADGSLTAQRPTFF